MGRKLGLPIHTQIRIALDAAQAILETIKHEHIDSIIMGWHGETSVPGRVFGTVVDTVIRQAACQVVLVKLGNSSLTTNNIKSLTTDNCRRWLLLMAGGPNSQQAIQLLPALVTLSDKSEIRLTQVFLPSKTAPNTKKLEQAAEFLLRKINCPVITTTLCGHSVPDAAIDLAQKDQCDAIVLGASREGMLQQAIKGNIPEAIARGCDCTVILVRGAI